MKITSLDQLSIEQLKVLKEKIADEIKGRKKKKEVSPMSCVEFILWCKKSAHRHIHIIAEWADTVKPQLETKDQWQLFIKRNLRVAKQLEVFSDTQLQEAFKKIEDAERKGWLSKYTLDTLLKFLI